MRLDEIVSVRIGRNLSRMKEQNDLALSSYSYEDLMCDLTGTLSEGAQLILEGSRNNDDNYTIKAGDVVFSFVSSIASIVSEVNSGKIINQNFAKLIIDGIEVDDRYLCYALNESTKMKKQMAVSMQGSAIPKLTPSILKNLELELPNLEKQRVIGEGYFTLMKRQALVKKQTELEGQLYLEVLKRLDQ